MLFAHDAAQHVFDTVPAAIESRICRKVEFNRARRVQRDRLARIDPQPRDQPAKNDSLASTRRTHESALMRSATALSSLPIGNSMV